MMSGGSTNGGAAGFPAMPWKDPRSWTARDYDRLGEVLEEFYNRERGRRSGLPPGYNNAGVGGGGGGNPGPYPTWPMPPPGPIPPPRAPPYPGWPEYNRLEDQFRHMYDEYMRHRNENDSILYGSDVERRKDQYRHNMFKTLQDMWPQLNGQINAQMMMMGQQAQPQQMYGGMSPMMGQMPQQGGMMGGGMQPSMYPGMGTAGPGYGMNGPPMPPDGMHHMSPRYPRRHPSYRPREAFEGYNNDFDHVPYIPQPGWDQNGWHGPRRGYGGDGEYV